MRFPGRVPRLRNRTAIAQDMAHGHKWTSLTHWKCTKPLPVRQDNWKGRLYPDVLGGLGQEAAGDINQKVVLSSNLLFVVLMRSSEHCKHCNRTWEALRYLVESC